MPKARVPWRVDLRSGGVSLRAEACVSSLPLPALSGALHPLAEGPFSYPESFDSICFCFQPCSFSSKARRRLPSRQLLAWLDKIFSIVELIIPTTLDFYAEISRPLRYTPHPRNTGGYRPTSEYGHLLHLRQRLPPRRAPREDERLALLGKL